MEPDIPWNYLVSEVESGTESDMVVSVCELERSVWVAFLAEHEYQI